MKGVLSKMVDTIKAVAPTVANFIVPGSGPLAHSLMRAVTGDGPETPIEQVAERIEADPKLFLELQTRAMEHEVRMAEIEARKLATVNLTMQVEGKSEHWPQYCWRPFWGFASGTAFIVICVFFCFLAWQAITKMDANAMAMIPQLVTSFIPLFGIAGAVLGITTWGRNRLKEKLAGGK